MIRLSGLLQVQEWMAFDSFSRSCPSEQGNASVVVVGIDEADLSHVGGYPIPDRDLAIALKNLQAYHPSAIGLDLFRDRPVEPGHAELVQALQTMPNLIGTEVALNAKPSFNIKPPPGLPPERVGFVDSVVDTDGKLRRSLLASSTPDGEMKYSLAFRLAQTHLAKHGVTFNPGDRPSVPLRFGTVSLPRFQSNSGGYVQADAKGKQLLLNFCGTQKMVRSLSLKDVLENNVPPDWIRDHVVMIGMTASSIKDIFFTAALREPLNARLPEAQMSVNQIQMPTNQVIYGVEAHAYTVDYICAVI
jgi:CHASE2 domain-containing sensor protein